MTITNKSQSAIVSLNEFSHRDVLIHIFSFLDAIQLGKISRVSTLWRELSNNSILWANQFKKMQAQRFLPLKSIKNNNFKAAVIDFLSWFSVAPNTTDLFFYHIPVISNVIALLKKSDVGRCEYTPSFRAENVEDLQILLSNIVNSYLSKKRDAKSELVVQVQFEKEHYKASSLNLTLSGVSTFPSLSKRQIKFTIVCGGELEKILASNSKCTVNNSCALNSKINLHVASTNIQQDVKLELDLENSRFKLQGN